MKTPTLAKLKYLSQGRMATGGRRGYEGAWDHLYRVSAKLPRLWKTKKTSLQILKAERAS